jgi:hypothetical protein
MTMNSYKRSQSLRNGEQHNDTLEVPTMDEINTKENDSDTVLINNNINSKCKSSARNTSRSVKSDSDSNKHSLVTIGDSHTRGCAS